MGALHCISNCFNNFMDILQDIIICKSDNTIFLFLFKPSCSFSIVFFLFQMGTPIYLDNQFLLNTNKVKNESANSMLPAEI